MESIPASAAISSEDMADNFSADFLSSSPVRGEIGKSANNFDGMEIGTKEECRERSRESPDSCSPCPTEDDQRFSAVWTNGQLTKATGRKEGDSGFISPAGATNNGHVGMESVNPFNEVSFHQGLGKTSSNDYESSKTPSLGNEPEDKVLDSSLESENDNHYSYDNGKEDHEISTNGFNNYNIYNQDMESKFDQTDNFFAQESEKTVIKGDIMDLKPVSDNFEDIQNFNNLENHQNGINNENFSYPEENIKDEDTLLTFDSKEDSPAPTEEHLIPANNGFKDNQLISHSTLNEKPLKFENDLDLVHGEPESSPELYTEKNVADIDTFSNCDEQKLIEEPEKEDPGYNYKLTEDDGCIVSDPMTTSMFQMKDTEKDYSQKDASSSDEEDHSEKKDEEKDYPSSASEAEEEQPYEKLKEDVDKECMKTEALDTMTNEFQRDSMDLHNVNNMEGTASSDIVHLDKEEHNIEFKMQEQQYGEEPIEEDYNNLTNDSEMGNQINEDNQKGFGGDQDITQKDQVLDEGQPKLTPTPDAFRSDQLADFLTVKTDNCDHIVDIQSEEMEETVINDHEKIDDEIETNGEKSFLQEESYNEAQAPINLIDSSSDSSDSEAEGPVANDTRATSFEIEAELIEEQKDEMKEIEEFAEESKTLNFEAEEQKKELLGEDSQTEILLVCKETSAEKIDLPESTQLEENYFQDDEQMKMEEHQLSEPEPTKEEEDSIESIKIKNAILDEPVNTPDFAKEEPSHHEMVEDAFDIQKPIEVPVGEKFDGSEFYVGQAGVDPVINICAEVPPAPEVQSYQELDNNTVEEFVQEEPQSTALDTKEMQGDNEGRQNDIKEFGDQDVSKPKENTEVTLPGMIQPTVLVIEPQSEPVFDANKMQDPAYEIAKESNVEDKKAVFASATSTEKSLVEAVQSELHESSLACQQEEPKGENLKEPVIEFEVKKEDLKQEPVIEKEGAQEVVNVKIPTENKDVLLVEAKEEIKKQEISAMEPTQTIQIQKESSEKIEPEAVNTLADATSIETTNDYQPPSNDSVTNDKASDDTKPLVDEIKPAQQDTKPDEKVSAADVAQVAKSATKSVVSAVKKSPKPPTTLALTKTTPKAAGKPAPAPTSTRAVTKPRVAPPTTKAATSTGPKTTTRPTSASLASAKPLTNGAARPSTRPATTRPATAPTTSRAPLSRPQTTRPATTSTKAASSAAQGAGAETRTLTSTSVTPAPRPAGVTRMKITPRTTSTSRLREASAARVKAERATTPASKPQTPAARTPLASRTTPTTKTPTKRTPTKPTSASASSKELANTPFAKRQARLRAKSTEKKPAPAESKETAEVNGTEK